MQKPFSIRTKLILWLILPLTIFSIVIFIYFYYALQEKINTLFDDRLYVTAQSIEENIGIQNDKLFVDFSNFYIDFLSSNDEGVIYYSVENENGDILIGHENLFKKNKLKNNIKVFYNTFFNGYELKAVSYKAFFTSSGKTHIAYITIAQSKEERNKYIKEAFILMSFILTVVYLMVIGIILLALNRGLSPLVSLKKIIQKREVSDLKPLQFNAPKELEMVVESINILLERSRENIKYIERFNADISHQLRTPIAELKMKLELLYNKNDKDFILLNSLLEKMSHLTEQLLLYAKTHANTINHEHFKKICLNDFCKQYSKKIAPNILKHGFEYSFEDINESVHVKADTILLESMLDNLINNCLKYAVDENQQPIGTITLSIQRHHNTIWLSVQDEGFGLDKEHQEHIFDRYYRADLQKHGSGLGLSIVKQIASLHHANVVAINNNGLKVSIIFNYFKSRS